MALLFRLQNKRLITDSYHLHFLRDHIHQAAHHKYYTTIDMNNGFWSLLLDEKSKPLTALITHKEQFEFNLLPFGIKNSHKEFKRAIDTEFGRLATFGILTYINNIIIYNNDFERMFFLIEVLK